MMQRRMVAPRMFYATFAFALLLALLATGAATQTAGAYASSHVNPLAVVNPHHIYAGMIQDKTFKCQSNTAAVRCYGPKQIRNAYSIQPLLDKGITGKGRTIVILDAYSAPHIKDDLHSFDQNFGLNDPTLNIIPGQGSLTPFDGSPLQEGWAGEIALDVEWSHAVAPDATIDLVLAKSSDDNDLVASLQYAIDHNLGDVVSMSFGEAESCLDAATNQKWHDAFKAATRKNITLFASAGDQGAAQPTCDGNSYIKSASSPANDPFVSGVGGTQLVADAVTGAYQSEVAWNEPQFGAAGGGGISNVYAKPFYQYGLPNLPGKGRGVPDVAYNAAINGGVLAVTSDSGAPAGSVFIFGGTSAGSPQWAGIIALADQLGNKKVGLINPVLYLIFGRINPIYSATFHDITSGNNTFTFADANGNPVTIQGYDAKKGWDAVTGWGSPVVSKFVPLLVLFTGGVHSHDFDAQKATMR
ncbi:S53 family peptidase [Dictyobacter aurantiacus]|uniref:Peptidase S53 domain-containing protein n=1 Tax=Dictyobacter aurantiacus TaxID=1936993 RepID=A0A401ZA68_9CHLR|nr:S53 family peptidase [Dictyobacter aurantiacus]GCE03745.1 hypothetical protein KDAU_10740 [Dictyobacter aurantiacus]